MNLVRWQPRSLVRTSPLHNPDVFATEMNNLMESLFGDFGTPARPTFPALDVSEVENRYIVHADLPGLTRDDVEITYQDGTLTLRGEKKSTRQEKKEGEKSWAYACERFEGKFTRTLHLSEKIDADRIEANFKNGVLELILPFTSEAQPRKIEIK